MVGIVFGGIYAYAGVVLYSLYDMLRSEYERGLSGQLNKPEV